MFGFLKDKLKGALKIFSKGVEEKGKTEEKTVEVEKPVEKQKPVEKKQPVQEQKSKKTEEPKSKSEIKKETPKKVEKKESEEEIQVTIRDKKPQATIVDATEQPVQKAHVEEIQLAKQEEVVIEKEEEKPLVVFDQTTNEEQTSQKKVYTPVIEEEIESKPAVEEVEEPVVKEQEAPKSLFSKFTSVFKKKEEAEEPVKPKKEQPKMVVETKRGTADGKIVEEKTVIQSKTVEQEEAEEQEKIEAQVKAAEQKQKAQAALDDAHKPKSFFEKITQVITTKTISQEQFEELFFDLEMAMLENNVAVQVIEKLKSDLQKNVVGVALKRGEIENVIVNTLKTSIEDVLSIKVPNLLKSVESKKPYVIAFIGVNGAGKTTNLAKVANYLKKNGKSVVIAACDTFRAAAIQQLEEHANRLDIKIIKHDYGADAAAVAFDAVAHAKSKNIDVVLIDTAGRLHSNSNLMDELAKIERVIQPDLKLFVGESVTGNDCIEQAMQFNEKIGIDGIILSKADVDEKGGAAISVSYVTQKPIYFIGTGQTYDDLEPFSKEKVLASLEL